MNQSNGGPDGQFNSFQIMQNVVWLQKVKYSHVQKEAFLTCIRPTTAFFAHFLFLNIIKRNKNGCPLYSVNSGFMPVHLSPAK